MAQSPQDDTRRLDWLEEDQQRLTDLYWHLQNREISIREAIDSLAAAQEA